MSRSIIPLPANMIDEENTTLFSRIARKLVHGQLKRIRHGEIILRENGTEYYFGHRTDSCPWRVVIDVHHPSLYTDVAFGGSPGSGEAYMKGSWDCSDLTALVRIMLCNRDVLDSMDYGITRIKAPLQRLTHLMKRNTRGGSRKNIHAHYDIGNDLFKLFLDSSMMYSSAYYEHPGMDLETASEAKLDLVCRKLALTADDHLLEIGTGWGGMAIYAAKHYGCRVTTTTISVEQYRYALERVREEGLADRIEVLNQDYRDLDGQYDKLVSIEMIEAIGHQYMDTYFSRCAELLKTDGIMLLQAITIRDQLYQNALKDVDFIKKYIFPGGFLPSVTAMTNAITSKTDMKLFHMQDIGPHYARTLRDWKQRFLNKIDTVRDLGYPDEFIRLWEYYFSYCEGGFLEHDIGTVQIVLTRPKNRRDPILL